MSESTKGFIVHLEHDIHSDDLLRAIRCLRGVAKVTPLTSDFESRMAVERAKTEIRSKILDILWGKDK